MTKISDLIDTEQLGEPVRCRNLTLFPLLGVATPEPGYLTLDQASAEGLVRITEVSEGGSVPHLAFENRGASPVLLLDGEQLVGAKQNRVLNLSVLAPVGRTIEIPVSCVEAGRWAWDVPTFRTSERTHFAEGRARKAASVSASMAAGHGHYSDQGEVWDGIARKSDRMASHSPTAAMESFYQRHEDSLDDYLSSLAAGDDHAGAIFAIGERIIGMDLFAHAAIFARLFRKILSGYAIDALEAPRDAPDAGIDAARRFLDEVTACTPKEYPAVGLGTDLRHHSDSLAVSALVHEHKAVHLCAFALDTQTEGAGAGYRSASSRARSRGIVL